MGHFLQTCDIDNQQAEEDEQIDQLIIKTVYKGIESNIEIPHDKKTFKNLAQMLAPYYKCNQDQIFFTDESENVFLDCMDIRTELNQPLDQTLKNTYPEVHI